MKGTIYLEDGTVYKGTGFGFRGTRTGELVFNTAMTGYQKTMTDPSYPTESTPSDWWPEMCAFVRRTGGASGRSISGCRTSRFREYIM